MRDLAPDASPAAVLAAAGWPEHKGAVLVVGHQPTLGLLASMLIAGEPMPWSVKKGGGLVALPSGARRATASRAARRRLA